MTTPKARYEIVADDKTSAAWKSAIGQADAASKKLTNMFLGFAGGGALAAGMVGLAKNAAAFALEMDDVGDRMQIAASDASVMVYAFEQLDGSVGALEKGFKEFRVTLSEASRGKDSAVALFRELGLSIDDLRAKRPKEQMLAISEAFEVIKDPIERARVAQELFSKSGSEWVAVLGQGADKMREYMNAAVELDDRGTAALESAEKATSSFFRSLKVGVANVAGITLSAFVEDTRAEIDQLESEIKLLDDRAKSIRLVAISDGQIDRAEQYEAEAAALRKVLDAAKMRAEWDAAAAQRADEASAFQGVDPSVFANLVVTSNAAIANSEAELLVALRKTNDEYAKRWSETQDGAEDGEQLRRLGEIKAAEQDNLEALLTEEDARIKDAVDSEVEYRVDQNKWGTDELNQYQIQAQRNTQNLIADNMRMALKGEYGNIVKDFGEMLLDLAIEAQAAKLATWLFGDANDKASASGGGAVGDLLRGIGDWFGGPRAEGGSVSGGKGYLIGERGPELFFPGSSGFVAPNHALAGGGATINNYITVPPGSSVSRADLDAAMRRSSDVTIARLRAMNKTGRQA